MVYSPLSRANSLNHRIVWNLSQHTRTTTIGSQSDLTSAMIPLMNFMSMTDQVLNRGQRVSPHWHPDSNELCYVINGEFSVTVIEPLSESHQAFVLVPGCAVYIPAGWYHDMTSLSDDARLISIYSTDEPHIIEALVAWSMINKEEHKMNDLPVQPVFNLGILHEKAPDQTSTNRERNKKDSKKAAVPSPPLLTFKS
ncbi:cupin domain-containing protein [Paenibacillus sp. N3/727]|uniref:cupin domain-containing protein n=1 Tax=Paenibacillus sp. N3/727 TaxID=2925845 RepID=UPI001F52E015|nr:cupin domain-containing protein [Paenibacillus sp. N3/727]UNK16573.1 cupin domain-containing protein [Paenibacillus sp. N3/727]